MGNSSTRGAVLKIHKSNIVQAVQGVYTGTQSITMTTASTWYDVPNLSVSITPSRTDSIIILLTNLNIAASSSSFRVQLYRNGTTEVCVGSGSDLNISYVQNITSGTKASGAHFIGIDSPASTSAQTYTMRATNVTAATTAYVNRSVTDTNTVGVTRVASNMIALEVVL